MVDGIWEKWTDENWFSLEPMNSDCPDLCIPLLIYPSIGIEADNGCSDNSDIMLWEFDWMDCVQASAYHLQVIHMPSGDTAFNRDMLNSSEFFHPAIEFKDNDHLSGWIWKVRAMIDGVWGTWSPDKPFQLEAADTDCPEKCTPQLISPEPEEEVDNGCFDQTDLKHWIFDWEDCPDATAYQLAVTHSDQAQPVIDIQDLTESIYSFQTNEITLNEELLDWRWKVRAKVNGEWGAWSAERIFKVEPVDWDCGLSKVEPQRSMRIWVYPNPTNGEVHVQMENAPETQVRIFVFDNTGRMCLQNEYKQSPNTLFSLDLAQFNKGIYFLKIDMNESLEIRKIIKY